MINKYTFILLLSLFCFVSFGQEQVTETKEKEKKAFKITGNLGISLGGYKAFGIDNRRDPFSYQVMTNLGFTAFGVNVPIGAFFGQQELPTLQPFNQIGFSPQYKWIKSHIGYRSMQFSPYTLNNHTFLGAGIEITLPNKSGPVISVAGLYGRFRRPIESLRAQEEGGVASYKRMGWGAKLGLAMRKKSQNKISFSLFSAEDKINSIASPEDPLELLPHQNLVVGITAEYELVPKLTAKIDYATSAFTRDARVEEVESLDKPLPIKIFGDLFTPKGSSQYNDALKTELNYRFTSSVLGISYEKIEPGYTTLGSYYFQNDLENILANASFSLNQGKIQLSASIGKQRDNLDNAKQTENTRFISSLNYNQRVNDNLNINASFSNFSSSLKAVLEEITDSVNLFQISTNINLGANYRLNSSENNQSLFGNISYQIGNSRDEYEIFKSETSFWNFSGGYRRIIAAKNMNLGAMLNFMSSETEGITNTRVGPTLSIGKQFLDKKLRAIYAFSYLFTYVEGTQSDHLTSNRISIEYQLMENLKTSLRGAHFYKNNKLQSDASFSELRGIFSVSYSF